MAKKYVMALYPLSVTIAPRSQLMLSISGKCGYVSNSGGRELIS
jgi:hypothetical protein